MKYDILYKSKLVRASALTLIAFLLFLGSVKSLRFAFVVAELCCLAIVAIIVGLIVKQTGPYRSPYAQAVACVVGVVALCVAVTIYWWVSLVLIAGALVWASVGAGRAAWRYYHPKPYDLDVRLRAEVHMPTPQEIEQALARLHCALDGKSDTILNQPPHGAIVECEECDVQEIYPRGNDAAQSTHLLTHPTRCTVRT